MPAPFTIVDWGIGPGFGGTWDVKRTSASDRGRVHVSLDYERVLARCFGRAFHAEPLHTSAKHAIARCFGRAFHAEPLHTSAKHAIARCFGRAFHAEPLRAIMIAAVSAALISTLGGCANNGDSPTAALPNLPALPKIALPEAPPPVVGSATEVYERIGRGAMACWFGADGFLKASHIYEAAAEPASKGGKAEILIRARDNAAETPRGVKAFRISIAPSGEDETTVVAENLKLPEDMANKMKKSVAAWSIGEQGCDPDTFKGAWQAAPAQSGAAENSAQKQKTTQPKRQVAKE